MQNHANEVDRCAGPSGRRATIGRFSGRLDSLRIAAAAGAIVGIVGLAHAGPEWEERTGTDAGPLPASAQPVAQIGGGPLERIKGGLAGLGPIGGDFQDMYRVFISNPAIFSAAVFDENGTGFDTQIFLFDSFGLGQLANDDAGPGAPPAATSFMGNMATDGTGQTIINPGIYLMAISGSDSDPLGVTGSEIFLMPPGSTEVSGPDGMVSTPVSFWDSDGETGSYTVRVTGCQLIPIQPCPGDFSGDGMVGIQDLLLLLSYWGVCIECPFSIDGNNIVNTSDLLDLLAVWGPCP